MRLKSLKIDNFIAIEEFDKELEPIVLVCGENNVGKSSLQEAIRIAFTGESARVSKKKDYKSLVRQGAKRAKIEVGWSIKRGEDVVESRAMITLPTPGKAENEVGEVPPDIGFILDAHRLASMSEDDRRTFLFRLSGVKVGIEDALKRIKEKGVPANIVEQCRMVIRAGFEACCEHAERKAAEARAEWRQVTGEDWGSLKGDVWKPSTAPRGTDETKLKELRKLEEEARELSKALLRRMTEGELFLDHQEKYQSQADKLRAVAGEAPALKEQLDELRTREQDAQILIGKMRAQLDAINEEGLRCPKCDTELLLAEGGTQLRLKTPVEDAETATTFLQGELDAYEVELSTVTAAIAKVSGELAGAERAAGELVALNREVGLVTTKQQLAEWQDEYTKVNEKVKALSGELADLEARKRLEMTGKEKAAQAKQWHQTILGWVALRDACSPDGVPSDILAEGIGPINKRLAKCAMRANWPQVAIRKDLAIVVGGVPYNLCGESMRWRADMLLAEAVSHFTGINMLIMDRMDVLHPNLRMDAIDLCRDLVAKDGYETCMLFATLKAEPVISGVQVIWMGGEEDG